MVRRTEVQQFVRTRVAGGVPIQSANFTKVPTFRPVPTHFQTGGLAQSPGQSANRSIAVAGRTDGNANWRHPRRRSPIARELTASQSVST